jgi:hypothetical protein
MNELTQKLIEAGCEPEKHKAEFIAEPHKGCKLVYSEYSWTHWNCLEYSPGFLRHMVFESPCGLLMYGISTYSHMGYMGITWCPENNNSVHACPKKKDGCKLNHKHLRDAFGHKKNILQCAFRFSNKVYDYENSYEKAWDDFHAMQERKKAEFYSKLKWDNPDYRFCACIKWDDAKHEWYAKYNPWNCVYECNSEGTCTLTGKSLGGKKGNVFYDLKVIRVRHDGTFWDGQKEVSITKG